MDFGIRASMLEGGNAQITNCDIDYNIIGVNIGGSSMIQREISNNNFSTDDQVVSPFEAGLTMSNTRVTGKFPSYAVHDNSFRLDNTPTGARFMNCENIRVYDNTIAIERPTLGSARSNSGIIVSNCGDLTIFNCNEVDLFDDDDGDYAMRSFNSPHVIFECNLADGRNGVQILGSNPGLQMMTNNMDGSDFDLIYGSSMTDFPTEVGPQPWHGNIFNQTTGSANEAVYYDATDEDILFNRYIVDEDDPRPTDIWPNSNPSDWFRDIDGNNLECTEQTNVCSKIPRRAFEKYENITPSGLDTVIIEGRYADNSTIWTASADSLAFVWTMRRHLYRALMDADQDSLDDYYRTFLDDFGTETVGKFEDVEKDLQDAFELTQAREGKIDTLDMERREFITDLNNDYANYLDTLSEYDSLDVSWLHPVMDSIALRSKLIDSLISKQMDEVHSTLSNVKTKNNAIPRTKTWETNEKTYNSVLISFLLSGVDTISSTNVDSLETIADQCFVNGGDAVIKAQALLDFYDGPRHYALDSLCQPVAQLSVPSDFFAVKELECYPNPATHELILKVPTNLIDKQVEIAIFSSNGKQVEHFKTVLQPQTMLPLRNLRNGFYFARVIDNSEVIGQFKFVKNDTR